MRRLLGSATVLTLAACSPFVSYPDIGSEASVEVCDDGVDNDLDGATDCADVGCATFCNRCGDVTIPTSDALGQLCNEDCECASGSSCNRAAVIGPAVIGSEGEPSTTARCAPETVLEDDGFDVTFTVEEFLGGVDPGTRSQNVQGTVRFNGVETPITSVAWDLARQTITFAAPPEGGQRSILFIFSFPVPRPAPSSAETVTIADEIEVATLGQGEQTGQFGPIPIPGDGDLALNQIAVVESSEITFDPLDETPAGFWRGRYSGRLRTAAGFDRWNACRTRPGRDLVYDAETGDCVTPAENEALFYLACAYRPDAERKLGEVAASWIPWWSTVRETLSVGECATEREGDLVRIRAAVDSEVATGASESWVLELAIPRFSVVADVGLEVGSDVEARLWQTDVAQSDDVTPLLELDLGPPGRCLEGRLRIDDQREGPNGRFLGWVRGTLIECSPDA